MVLCGDWQSEARDQMVQAQKVYWWNQGYTGGFKIRNAVGKLTRSVNQVQGYLGQGHMSSQCQYWQSTRQMWAHVYAPNHCGRPAPPEVSRRSSSIPGSTTHKIGRFWQNSLSILNISIAFMSKKIHLQTSEMNSRHSDIYSHILQLSSWPNKVKSSLLELHMKNGLFQSKNSTTH